MSAAIMMIQRPNAALAVLGITLALSLAACSKSQPAAGGHAAEKHDDKQHVTFEHVSADDGDVARGKALASTKLPSGQSCADCHGADGAKPLDATYPVIAGQYQDYIFHAIKQYRDGGRTHALMGEQIKAAAKAGQLDDQAIADLAAYFAAQNGPLGDLHGK